MLSRYLYADVLAVRVPVGMMVYTQSSCDAFSEGAWRSVCKWMGCILQEQRVAEACDRQRNTGFAISMQCLLLAV